MYQVAEGFIKLSQFLFYYSLILTIYVIYIESRLHKARLDRRTAKKFRKICKLEYRTPIEQEHLIINKFIEEYTKQNHIDWDELI